MTDVFLHILLCDDNVAFVKRLAADVRRKLAEEMEMNQTMCCIESISRLSALKKLSQNPDEALRWDAIFCDLGWGDLTLEGIQVLHDFQLSHPNIFTVLYTAQDENESVEQALEWKLHFVDRVLRVGEADFLEKRVHTIVEQWDRKESARAVPITGTRLLPAEMRKMFSEQTLPELKRLRHKISLLFQKSRHKGLTAAIDLSSKEMKLQLKADPDLQKQQRLMELIQNVQRFPKVETHDLIPLSKPAYIEFVQKKYGGFPQMAAERGLDLNNIYRVNRRFKNTPFVVFKYETIQEIIGIYDPEEKEKQITQLLCPLPILRKTAQT